MKKILSTLMGIFLCSYVSIGLAESIKPITQEPKEKIEEPLPEQREKIVEEPVVEKKVNSFENKYTKLAEELMPTVVVVHVRFKYLDVDYEEQVAGVMGSGVFISENGHILTCAHLFHSDVFLVEVMKENKDVMIAELLYIDKEKDLALLKTYYEEPTLYAKVSDRDPKVGESVIAIGNPLGLLWTFTTGIISGINRMLRPNQDLIQTDAVINPGNSGGPLFDIEGNIIGINVMIKGAFPIPNWSGQSFAVSTKEIREFLDKFKGL